MRTIGSTFSTRDEAERASGDLQSLGVPRERILVKYLAQAGPATAEGKEGVADCFFLSAKVEPDQLPEATKILGRGAKGEAAGDGPAEAAAPAPQPLPDTPAPEARTARDPVQLGLRPDLRTSPRNDDLAGWGRRLVKFGLFAVVAYIAGAAIGTLL